MKYRVFTKTTVMAAVLLLVQACAWVKLTDGGANVLLRSNDQIEYCEKIGATSASVAAKVGFVDRDPQKMATELQALARNEAAKMGGNTIVVDSIPANGSQRFRVYRCQ